MENVILTSIRLADLQVIIKDSVQEALKSIELKHHEIPDVILDVHEASDLLGISPATIYTKVSKREIPHMKRGKKLHFSRNELLKYLHGGRRKTAEEVEAVAQNYVNQRKFRA